MIYLLWAYLANWKRVAATHAPAAIEERRVVRVLADERVTFHGV